MNLILKSQFKRMLGKAAPLMPYVRHSLLIENTYSTGKW